jgi:hypothetical protein
MTGTCRSQCGGVFSYAKLSPLHCIACLVLCFVLGVGNVHMFSWPAFQARRRGRVQRKLEIDLVVKREFTRASQVSSRELALLPSLRKAGISLQSL